LQASRCIFTATLIFLLVNLTQHGAGVKEITKRHYRIAFSSWKCCNQPTID